MKPATKESLLFTASAILLGLLWTIALILSGPVVVKPFIPFAIGLAVSAMLFPLVLGPAKRKLANASKLKKVCLTAFYFACATPFVTSLLLGANKAFSNANPVEITAEISGKYTRQENEYRRAGRRRIYSGQHSVYYVTITLPDGRGKDYRVPVKTYVAARTHKPVKVTMHRGALGFDIIDNTSLKLK